MSWALLLYLIAGYWTLRIAVSHFRVLQDHWIVSTSSYSDTPAPSAEVSACVPARNEEAVIGSCVQSIRGQDHGGLRQLVLVDDCSSDKTSEQARKAARGDPRLQILVGAGPPDGWMGKSAACWRAQQEAQGEWLLFVDADVELHPRALSVALAAARQYGSDMVSWFGQLRTETFWEHVLMPFIGDFILLASPLKRVNDPLRDDCIANGQFILIRRSAYDAVDGHRAIRSSVIDDVSLSRSVKHDPSQELRYTLLHSLGLMKVRMYESFSEIWRGFAKNFFAAAQQKAGLLFGAVCFILITSVLPWLALPLLWLSGDSAGAAAAGLAVAATLSLRLYTLRFSPVPGWTLLFHPIAAVVTCGIMIDSTLRGLGLLGPVAWKGRPVS
ncbi:MAG: glycosyltransferase family 2 protein [Myxococcota bacterium]|nr:glycosyltransferase family 2 protein [Myxococcota bacterium]